MKINIIGATGNVGRKVLEIILEHKIFPENIGLFASRKSAGKIISIGEKDFTVLSIEEIEFKSDEIYIFNTEADISARYIPDALARNAYIIDSSSHYRLDENVPLIVPPVNLYAIAKSNSRLYSHANCMVSPIATVIQPIHQKFGIGRIIASTYQSTSGAGKKAMDECMNQTIDITQGKELISTSQIFPRQIAFNVIPEIGSFNSDNVSGEEQKIVDEIHKIIDPSIYITMTTVRVPVMVGHCVSMSIRLKNSSCEVNDIISTLSNANNVVISDNNHHTPIEIEGSDDVFVGRIRMDAFEEEKWLHLWLCSDNLRRGAATDAVEIAEAISNKI